MQDVYTTFMNTRLLDEVRQLSVEDQLELVEALWDEITKHNAVPPPTAAQKAELDRRVADQEAHSDDVVSWDEVKASARDRIRRKRWFSVVTLKNPPTNAVRRARGFESDGVQRESESRRSRGDK